MLPTGWCPGDRSMVDMQAMYPDTSAVRIFFQPGEGLPASAWTDPRQELSQAPPGSTVIVSHKDVDVDAGAFVDAGRAARPDVRCVLLPHHEPEQQTGGDPTPAQFDASWTRTAQQVAAHPARAEGWLRLAVCYTLVWVRQGNDWRKWFPDHVADAVDLVLGDWYPYMPGTATPWKPTVYEDPASALKVLEDIAAATGKGWGIGEINHSEITKANGYSVDLDPTGVLCADWYRRMHAHAKARGCRVWTHFHRGGGDLGNRPAVQQALRDLIGQEASMGRWTDLAKWVGPTPNQSGAMNRHDGVVIHIAAGTYDGTIAWQRNPDADVSSHFIVAKDGRVAQMVDTNVTAWTQRDGNGEWLSVENAGFLPDPLTAEQVEANARILAKAHQVYGVPLQVTNTPATRGLGHHSMGAESGYDWGHPACPGAAIKAQKAEIVARAKQIINGEDDAMPTAAEIAEAVWSHPFGSAGLNVPPQAAREWLKAGVGAERAAKTAAAGVATLRTEVADGFGRDLVDEAQVAGQLAPALLAVLTPEAIVAAIPGELAEQVADVLAARLAS